MAAFVRHGHLVRRAPDLERDVRDRVDYSLTGPSGTGGRRHAGWPTPNGSSRRSTGATLRALQTRTNGRAGSEVVIWLVLLVGAGVWAWTTVWSWWSIPAFAIYGALYGGSADPDGTSAGTEPAFRSRRVNDFIYPIASFMLFRGPTVWRWSHYRHHTDTIIVGRDAEIVFQRPRASRGRSWMFTHIEGGSEMFWRFVEHAFGRVDDDAREFVPENEHPKIVWESRIMVAIVAGAAIWSLVAWTPLPILFIGGPSIYGAWLMVFFGITQHAGLRENMLDHRYSTRTVYMNRCCGSCTST